MKLQLNESTLNAYINEAIKQELNENWLTKTATKVGSKAGKAIKGAAKGTKNYVKALGGNKKAVQKSEKMLKSLKDELAAVEKEQKAIWGTANSGARGHELATRRNTLIRRIKSVESSLEKAKAGKTLARTATGTAATGFGAGYLAGRSGKNGQNPDAPWNDGIADSGMNGDAQDETSGNGGGFDGTFPWDNTTPVWTPRKPRTPAPTPATPAPVPTTQEPAAEETPASTRPRVEPIDKIATPSNMSTGVTSNQPEPTIQRRYAPGTDPNNVNKWNNTANFRRLSGQLRRGVSPDKAVRTLQNRRERQEKRYDKISSANGEQSQRSAQ